VYKLRQNNSIHVQYILHTEKIKDMIKIRFKDFIIDFDKRIIFFASITFRYTNIINITLKYYNENYTD